MKNYKKFLELQKTLKKYADGGKVKEEHDKKNLQALKSSFEKFIKEESKEKAPAKFADGGEVKEDDSYFSDFAKKLKEAFKTPEPKADKEETLEDKYKKIRQQNTERASGQRSAINGFADGGTVNTVSNIAPLLKETYGKNPMPKEKKYPLNVPKNHKIKIPKRLSPIDIVKGYADGGYAVNSRLTPEEYEQQAKDLLSNEQQIPPTSILESQYGPEEEAANQAAGMTSDAEAGLLDEKPQDQRSLEGMTLSKNDLDEDKNPWYANKDGVLEGMKDEGDPTEELQKSKLDVNVDTSRKPAGEEVAPKPEEAQPAPYNPITALNEAQSNRNQSQMWNQLAAISERGAAGYAGIKPTQQETYKENMQIAQQAVDDVKDRIKQQGDDPNSPISQSFKKYLAKFSGEPIDPNMTANAGKETLPLVFKDYEAKLAQQTRKEMLNEKLQDKVDAREAEERKYKFLAEERKANEKEHAKDREAVGKLKTEEKQEQRDVDRVDKMNKMISEDIASGRSAFGLAARNRQTVDNVKALLSGSKDLNDLDDRQVVEVAKVLDRVLSGGNATISGSEHLTPESAHQWLSKKMEFISSKRQGAGAGSFVKTMAETLNREGEQADKQIKASQGQMIGTLRTLEKNNPDSKSYQNYVNMLRAHHLDALLPKDEQEVSVKSEEKSSEKKVVKKGYNSKTNQTQLIYDDGSTEIKDGKI